MTGNAPWSPLLTLCQSKARSRIRRHYTEAAAAREIRVKMWNSRNTELKQEATEGTELQAAIWGLQPKEELVVSSLLHQDHLQNVLVSSTHTSTHTHPRVHTCVHTCMLVFVRTVLKHSVCSTERTGHFQALREEHRRGIKPSESPSYPRRQSGPPLRGLQHRLQNDFYLPFTMEIGY